jgi:hypothetical protein
MTWHGSSAGHPWGWANHIASLFPSLESAPNVLGCRSTDGVVCKRGKPMRVSCEGVDGINVEGEVIAGDRVDESTGMVDLDGTFTVRCDDGVCFTVRGWLVDIEVLVAEAS